MRPLNRVHSERPRVAGEISAVFPAVMPFVFLRPITDSNRIPSYLASANEPDSNRHFLSGFRHILGQSARPQPLPTYSLPRVGLAGNR